MTCYGDPGYSYRITNSAGDTMVRDTYTKLHNDYAVSKFTVPEAGYYYVELNGSKSSEQKYVFMIGSPTYVFAVQNISCVEGSVSMTSGGRKQTVHFDGSTVPGLPEDALACTVTMDGIPLNATSAIRLKNDDRDLSFTLTRYTWYKNGLISMNLPVESMWTADFEYNNKVVTFTPSLRMSYVNPVYE